ncbi:MAG: hypothetical protein ACI89G_003198 [Minisyncoccia bacterium]|jgi:hypothetical protein
MSDLDLHGRRRHGPRQCHGGHRFQWSEQSDRLRRCHCEDGRVGFEGALRKRENGDGESGASMAPAAQRIVLRVGEDPDWIGRSIHTNDAVTMANVAASATANRHGSVSDHPCSRSHTKTGQWKR